MDDYGAPPYEGHGLPREGECISNGPPWCWELDASLGPKARAAFRAADKGALDPNRNVLLQMGDMMEAFRIAWLEKHPNKETK